MQTKPRRDIDKFIEATKKMVGQEVCEGRPDSWMGWPTGVYSCATRKAIQRFAFALGCDNPLFVDGEYASKSRYECIIAPPTFIAAVRYTMAHGAIYDPETGKAANIVDDYGLGSFFSGTAFEWNDVIRIGTRFDTSLKLKEVYEKKGRSGRLIFLITDGDYWDQHGDVLAKCRGTLIFVKPETDITKKTLYNVELHKYSQEDLDKIERDINNEERRGAKPRLWEKVNEGDELTPVVKGPLGIGDFINFRMAHGGPRPFELGYHDVFGYGKYEKHPLTGWYQDSCWEHEDPYLAGHRGMALPFDMGIMRVCLAEHLLTNWQGDDGFLRRLDIQIRKPYYYSDTLWYKGKVVKKYKDVVSDKEYNAVDIEISGVNQRKESICPGSATVYLPSRGKEVDLPVPSGYSKL